MAKADPLIRTKLHMPFTRPGLVSRPRLQEQIAQGLCTPLTLITAPAGFGKTTLVASCVAGCGMPIAWLSLDKNDNQAERFLNYLVAALQEADHTIGSEAAQLLAASQQAPLEAVVTSLINDLDGASGLLRRLASSAEAGSRNGRLIEILLLETRILRIQNQREQALRTLELGIRAGKPGDYIRTYVDEGIWLEELLRLEIQRGSFQEPLLSAYLQRILAALSENTEGGAARMIA